MTTSRRMLSTLTVAGLFLTPLFGLEAQGGVDGLRWLDGRWRGSGGAYPSFFEEYRIVNDSTIEQFEVADSTFARVTSNGLITVRNGRIVKLERGGGVSTYIRVVGDTATFTSASNPRNSYRWIRTGPDTWRAELGSVTYVLRRVPR